MNPAFSASISNIITKFIESFGISSTNNADTQLRALYTIDNMLCARKAELFTTIDTNTEFDSTYNYISYTFIYVNALIYYLNHLNDANIIESQEVFKIYMQYTNILLHANPKAPYSSITEYIKTPDPLRPILNLICIKYKCNYTRFDSIDHIIYMLIANIQEDYENNKQLNPSDISYIMRQSYESETIKSLNAEIIEYTTNPVKII